MMRLCLLLFGLLALGLAEKERYDNDKIVRIHATTDAQLKMLKELEMHSILDFWTDPVASASTDVRIPARVWPQIEEFLKIWGFTYEITVQNVQSLVDEEAASNRRFRATSIVGSYPTHAQINSWIEAQANQHSSIASITEIGKSTEGRQMKLIKIGRPSSNGAAKPAIWIDAGIHAREWISPATAIYMIDKILRGAGRDAAIDNLISKYDWYVLPSANPDGYEYSRTSKRVADKSAAAIQAVNGLRFRVGTPPDILYKASGGSQDWAKATAGIKYSYTFELRPTRWSYQGFILPTSHILPSGKETWNSISTMISSLPY